MFSFMTAGENGIVPTECLNLTDALITDEAGIRTVRIAGVLIFPEGLIPFEFEFYPCSF